MNTKELLYYNGFGGFSKEGKEYVISTAEDFTPLPWSHMMANEKFGCLVTANGGGYVWSGNSRENKITVWSNDVVEDRPSEVLWLEKKIEKPGEKAKQCGCRFLLPYESLKDFVVTYGFGYAEFEREENEIKSCVTIFVPRDEAKKVYEIRLKNASKEEKQFLLQYQMTPVLGVSRDKTKKHLLIRRKGNGIMIENRYREDYAKEVVYISASEEMKEVKTEEKEVQLAIEICLPPKEEKKIILELGVLEGNSEIHLTSNPQEKLQKVKNFWEEITRRVKVKTPVESMNILLNGWLIYQTLVSRLWGRTSFYQAGGAFGFRDQLQDSLMILYYKPELTRNQILYHAEHQFWEGDVLHWWHPEKDNGIRTRYSDDLLWLPFVLSEYIQKEKDFSILEEEVPYVKMDLLKDHENERYEKTTKTEVKESIYLHAKRAIEKSLCFGKHGLPKMGSGDWNDGMNKVSGESVWLGFFLYEVLKRFCKLCEIKEDKDVEKYLKIMENLRMSLNQNAWDGSWFQRAFYQNGEAVGSHDNEECKIDSISQSWSVISGAGDTEKTKIAMESLENYLVDRENMIIKLLTPSFHFGENDPGYIKCYIPGVRENGGQYTHGAVWSIIANAKLGAGEKAFEYFRFLNPIEHARTKEAAMVYKVEPYVVVADIYSTPNMLGRGGWSWYTGSSSWLFMAGFENVLGIQKIGDILFVNPCVAKDWESYQVSFRFKSSTYHIHVYNTDHQTTGIKTIYDDNNHVNTNKIKMVDDGLEHSVDVIMG